MKRAAKETPANATAEVEEEVPELANLKNVHLATANAVKRGRGLMIILAFTGDGYLKTYSKYEHSRERWPTGSGHGYSCSKNSTHDTDSKKRPTQSILPTHLSKGEYRDSYTKVYSSVLHFTMDTGSHPTIVALYNSMLGIS